MNEKILINPKTNQEYRDVPPTVAAEYLGVALNYVYEGLKKQTLPIGSAVQSDKGRWSYNIPILGRLPKVINHIYALLAVTVGFVIFRADTIGQGFDFIGNMFAGFNITDKSLSLALTQLTPWFIVVFVAAIIGCAPIKPIADKFRINGSVTALVGKKQNVAQTVLYVLAFAMLIWCIIRLSGTSYNPFIYFRF